MAISLLEEELSSRRTAKITISFLYLSRRFLLYIAQDPSSRHNKTRYHVICQRKIFVQRQYSFLHHTGINMQNLSWIQKNCSWLTWEWIRAELSSNAFVICKQTSLWYDEWVTFNLCLAGPWESTIYDTVLMPLWKSVNCREINTLITGWKSFCCGVSPPCPLLTGKAKSTQIASSSLLPQWIFLFEVSISSFRGKKKWPFSCLLGSEQVFHKASAQT